MHSKYLVELQGFFIKYTCELVFLPICHAATAQRVHGLHGQAERLAQPLRHQGICRSSVVKCPQSVVVEADLQVLGSGCMTKLMGFVHVLAHRSFPVADMH